MVLIFITHFLRRFSRRCTLTLRRIGLSALAVNHKRLVLSQPRDRSSGQAPPLMTCSPHHVFYVDNSAHSQMLYRPCIVRWVCPRHQAHPRLDTSTRGSLCLGEQRRPIATSGTSTNMDKTGPMPHQRPYRSGSPWVTHQSAIALLPGAAQIWILCHSYTFTPLSSP